MPGYLIKIAIDLNIMSNGGKRVIDAVMPNVDFVDSSSIFNELRVIKSPWEIKDSEKVQKLRNMGSLKHQSSSG